MQTYSPDEIVLTVNGFPITSRGKDAFLKIEQDEDQGVMTIGVDGEASLTRVKNESATITITVAATGAANDVLMSAYAAFKAIGAVSAIFAKDLNGKSLHVAERCFPVKLPSTEYGKEAGEREWVFRTDRLVSTIGSSNLAPSAV